VCSRKVEDVLPCCNCINSFTFFQFNVDKSLALSF
jgi:hypothetical protein